VSRAALVAIALALAALAGAGIALVTPRAARDGEANAALPKLHGQATWAAGERRAPVFALRDQDGRRVSLRKLQGRPVALTFLDSRCHEQCPAEGRMLGVMLRQMPAAVRPTLVVVSVNPPGDTPASIRHAMAEWRLAGSWRWHWLRGSEAELARVWRDYGIGVQTTASGIAHGMSLYLVDSEGFERSGYLFPYLPNFVQLDLRTLARESGPSESTAYSGRPTRSALARPRE
jgi:cytochrome oxidase Cu insertion factor (SCO1/SenC/PrrC family)